MAERAERYHGPMNRMIDERVPSKKKVKVLSPKRRHLKRPVSPEKQKLLQRRPEPSAPLQTKKKDKGVEKVREEFG